MRTLFLTLALIALTGCKTQPHISLKEAQFAVGPEIIQRGDHFYLRYRRALVSDRYPLRVVLDVKKTKDAGYYFFIGQISYPEWGNTIERPLAYDDLEDLARRGQIYWLDPDGTQHPLPVRSEPL